ncbi:MAG: alkaline phosphatase family protein, partial [Thermoanaerobaculia bacterium]
MTEPGLDGLRAELRNLGYLTHGIERWFALDPWSSRAFWSELAMVALKAAALLALFVTAPPVAIMAMRNDPLSLSAALLLSAVYAIAGLFSGIAVVFVAAMILKLKPSLAIDSPATLLGGSIAASLLLIAPLIFWWSGFDSPPTAVEIALGGALLVALFAVATLVFSAALLSFSIHETRRIPAIARRSPAAPIVIAATLLALAIVVFPLIRGGESAPANPPQIVVAPSTTRLALLGVDGLSHQVLAAHPRLAAHFEVVMPTRDVPARSATERWATIGTGTPASAHGVHAIDGIRPRGAGRVLQNISRADAPLRLAARAGIAESVALPPTERRRAFVWEVFASRGVSSGAVNWWTSEDVAEPNLHAIAQETVYAGLPRTASAPDAATAIDRTAAGNLLAIAATKQPRFITAYLPALDIVSNRLEIDAAPRLARSVALLDRLAETVASLEAQGYGVMLVGVPGETDSASRAVIATTFALDPGTADATVNDVAPTLCALYGFPATVEMPGRVLTPGVETARIAGFGERRSPGERAI